MCVSEFVEGSFTHKMPKRAEILTDLQIRALRAPGRKAAGNGLTIEVMDDGRKKWLFRYRLEGKPSMLTLGYYPAVGIKEAGKKLTSAKALLHDGIDPAGGKRRKRAAPAQEGKQFREIALEWLKTRRTRLKPRYAGVVHTRLEKFLFPELGDLSMEEITPPVLLKVIRKIEQDASAGLARRMVSAYGQISRFAIASGRAERDPSRDIKDGLAPLPRVKHRASLKASELGPFLVRLAALDCQEITRLAIEFTLRTAARTNETRFALWSEFDGLGTSEAIWRLSLQRMKMDRGHVVPIVPQVERILARARELNPHGEIVFPSAASRSGFMSENAMLYATYRMGLKGSATIHGFRGWFSTIANENGWPADHIELCLAHVQGNSVRAAYNAAQYLGPRRKLLEWWSNYLDETVRMG